MSALGPYASFIVTSYLLVAAVVLILIVWILIDYRRQQARLRELEASGVTRRALNQAARELLLAQSSDWAFIIKTGTMVDYAVRRTREHLLRFTKLYDQIKGNQVDEGWLGQVESRDNLFPEIDYRVYRPQAA